MDMIINMSKPTMSLREQAIIETMYPTGVRI